MTVRVVGQPAAVLGDDDPRRRVQVAGPGVVAEALPGLAHRRLGGRRQVVEGRVLAQEAPVVALDPVHLGLLQHDLGDQDPVGVAGPPPGQLAPLGPVPGQQPALEAPHQGGRAGPAFRASEMLSRCVQLQPMARWKPIRKARRWFIAECTRLLTTAAGQLRAAGAEQHRQAQEDPAQGRRAAGRGRPAHQPGHPLSDPELLVALRAVRRRRAAQGRSRSAPPSCASASATRRSTC